MKMEMLSCGPLAGIAIVVLTLLCGALAWMYLSLHRKNKLLYRQAEDTFRIKGAADHLLQSLPEAQLTQDQLLFKRLTELLQEGEVFRDQQQDREKLANYPEQRASPAGATAVRCGSSSMWMTWRNYVSS